MGIKLFSPTVILIAGLPAVGKTTLAKALSAKLGVRHLYIDEDFRRPIFGQPNPDPYANPETKKAAAMEMGFAYDGLIKIGTKGHLLLGRSLIVTATFSRPLARANVRVIMVEHPEAKLKVIWCRTQRPEAEEIAEIQRRLDERKKGDYAGGCNSVGHYLDDKRRYPSMDLPHIEIDTLFLSFVRRMCRESAFLHFFITKRPYCRFCLTKISIYSMYT